MALPNRSGGDFDAHRASISQPFHPKAAHMDNISPMSSKPTADDVAVQRKLKGTAMDNLIH